MMSAMVMGVIAQEYRDYASLMVSPTYARRMRQQARNWFGGAVSAEYPRQPPTVNVTQPGERPHGWRASGWPCLPAPPISWRLRRL
jgi:hypothetical protein